MARTPKERARCRVQGKIRFSTRHQAETFLASVIRCVGSVYKCPHCNMWHCTTKKTKSGHRISTR